MALTASVVLDNVTSSEEDVFNVTLNLKVNDGTNDVIDQNFTQLYRKRNNLDTIAGIQEQFRIAMQDTIDLYKSADQIATSVALSNSITALEASLVE